MEGKGQGVGHFQNYKVPPPKVGEIRVLILKTPHSEGITLSKAQAEFFFLFIFLKLVDTHQVSREKMKKKKEAMCNERQNALSKGYKVSVCFFLVRKNTAPEP